jgi:hypothetical protein
MDTAIRVHPPIDLLISSDRARTLLATSATEGDILAEWESFRLSFMLARQEVLLYD